MDSYSNPGVGTLFVDAETAVPERTLIILGAARGGTSMMMGLLDILGVFIGDQAGSPLYEDKRLRGALGRWPSAPARAVIADYNAEHKVWANKAHIQKASLKRLDRLVRNPHYILVTRDEVAVAGRYDQIWDVGLLKSMRIANKRYLGYLDFIARHRRPSLLVSYEKALLHTEHMVEQLADFAGIKAGAEQMAKACAFVRPEPAEYVQPLKRHSRLKGFIDQVTAEHVSGWAAFSDSDDPVELQLKIDGREVARGFATHYRQDLADQTRNGSGRCAFLFDGLPEDVIGKESEVCVQSVANGEDLAFSPFPPERIVL